MSNASNPISINYKNLEVAKHKKGKYKDACEDYLRSIEIELAKILKHPQN